MDFKIQISDLPGTAIKRQTELTHFIWLLKEDKLRIKTRTSYLNEDLTPINEAIMPIEKDFDCDNSGYIDPATGLYVDEIEEIEGLVKDYDYYLSVKVYEPMGLLPIDLEGLPEPIISALSMPISELVKQMLANQIESIDQRQGFNK